ncbi:unnamed protein product [Effrenium voratum]|nr:unnamed protein product [Effrenium voratum]CAJ1440762.1 unnamed protein product [Effrenium voratum]|mmetsp:Transcript_45255/g.107544  ORF Transcript_45255/g.107544 Transcript_45255/m.107544 type:complete len:195 (+) Transcript_45255:60-644(+)
MATLKSEQSGSRAPKLEIRIPGDLDLLSYPPNYVQVRDTFIHVASPEEDALDDRAVASCPAQHIGRMRFEEPAENSNAHGKVVIRLDSALRQSGPKMHELWLSDSDWHEASTEAAAEEDGRISPSLPSVGSKGHATGECQPCAFVHTKGCSHGAACPFCHLCDRGEKKRRQKAKRDAFRVMTASMPDMPDQTSL